MSAWVLTAGLSGCGGGQDSATLAELAELPVINNYNYAYAYAVGAGAFERYGELDAIRRLALGTVMQQLRSPDGAAAGKARHSCANGGSIDWEAQAQQHRLQFQNCDTGALFLMSGLVTLKFNSPLRSENRAPLAYDSRFEAIQYRAESTTQMMQTLNGVQGTRLSMDARTQERASTYTVSRINKRSNYYVTDASNEIDAKEPDQIRLIVVRPDGANQFAQSFDLRGNLDASQITVTGRGDKSSITGYRLPPDGQTIRLEVRVKESATPTLVKAISAQDLQELIWRAL